MQWGLEGASPEISKALRREARALLALAEVDFGRFRDAVNWLIDHPEPGWYLRQLPVRGLDTKWMERHLRLVTNFVEARTGRTSLGLSSPSDLVRVKFLDPNMGPRGLREIAAPVQQLAFLDLNASAILVFENLESLAAMPDIVGCIGVHGSGYAVKRLGDIPWIRNGRVIYWGDLDSNGMAILNVIRNQCINVTSVLMDERTLFGFRDLWGTETTPNRGVLASLTSEEQTVLGLLREQGNVRLEQERIPWAHALHCLRSLVG
jgi:hypothetical protein